MHIHYDQQLYTQLSRLNTVKFVELFICVRKLFYLLSAGKFAERLVRIFLVLRPKLGQDLKLNFSLEIVQ